ncbi:MAG: 16S rRNA (guanine(527)-N(7))-methyltransferase RsmG [Pseudomonadota bacterium]
MARDFGVRLSPVQLSLFRIYLDELWDWNRRINLTGVSTRERVVTELFLDTLVPVRHLPLEGRMIDIGSGAGLPGLPFKIYNPRLELVLIEVKSKKVSFLKQVIRRMGLTGIEVIRDRIENVEDRVHGKGYHLVTARAFAGLHEILCIGSPLLCPGGLLFGFLGSGAESLLKENIDTLKRCGLRVHERIPYVLPGGKSERNILIFKKER